MQKRDRFRRGSGCYPCGVCKRMTRDTGDNGSCELCPECYEVAGYENYISDHTGDGGNDAELAHAAAEILRLNSIVVSKGGRL